MCEHVIGSVFDVYRAGAGPSSSHTIGPQRAASLFLARLKAPPTAVRVTLFGSLAATSAGHLTEDTIAGALGTVPLEVHVDTQAADLPHPNTLRFEALDSDRQVIESWTVWSTGGGNLKDVGGPVGQNAQCCYRVRTMAQALEYCSTQGLKFYQLVESNERDLWCRLEEIWEAMRQSVLRGIESEQEFLPGPLKLRRRSPTTFARAATLGSPQQDLALISAFALAVAEENAAGGRIVTAPTCGASGVLPGLLYYFEVIRKLPRKEILRALASAGLFGAVIRANASISGAEVGCQGEIGSACSMAAAAATQIMGGSLRQIEYAAEMGMEHHLGLTCDPVEGYVQVPCIERNMAAALRAFECASFALLTDGNHLISFDDVIEAMNQTGHDLQSAYRETAGGGLALLWRKRGQGR